MQRWLWVLGFSLVVVAAPVRAAGGACTASASECGRFAFQAGVRAFEAGRLEEARALFRRSLRLRAHPVILFNLALAEIELKEFDPGIAHLLQVRADPETDPELGQRVSEQLAAAKLRAGELRLDALLVRAARFRVNGRAPAQPGVYYAAPGHVRVTIELPGEEHIVRQMEVQAGDRRELVVMEAPALLAAAAERRRGVPNTTLYATFGLGAALGGASVASGLAAQKADTRTLLLGGSAVAVSLGGVLLWAFRDTTAPKAVVTIDPVARSLAFAAVF